MELYIPPKPITRNPQNGRLLRGYEPKNKGKKWGEYNVPEESRKKILANLSNEGRKLGALAKKKRYSLRIVAIKDKKFFGEFESAADAARILRNAGIVVYSENIRNCCKGKRPLAGGIQWFYENEPEKWEKEIKKND